MASRRNLDSMTLFGVDGVAAYRLVMERRATPSASYGRQFVIIFRDAGEILSGIKHPTAQRLSHLLPHMLSASDWRRLDQKQLAEKLAISQPSISAGLTVLIKAGLLEREGKGPGVRYRFSPRIGWKGTPGAYHAQQAEEGRNYAAEAAGYTLNVQLSLALPETRRGRKGAKPK